MSFWTTDVKSIDWQLWRRVATRLIGVAILLAVIFGVILPYWGIFLGIGSSLEPQVSWLSISYEVRLKPNEIPEVGHLYTYRRPASTAKTPVAKLRHCLGWRYATKWCWSVDEQSQTWATGTDDGDMPIDAIDRKVVAIWDWKRALRQLTEMGRMENQLDLVVPYGINRVWTRSLKGDLIVAAVVNGEIRVYDATGLIHTLPYKPGPTNPSFFWIEDTLYYPGEAEYEYLKWKHFDNSGGAVVLKPSVLLFHKVNLSLTQEGKVRALVPEGVDLEALFDKDTTSPWGSIPQGTYGETTEIEITLPRETEIESVAVIGYNSSQPYQVGIDYKDSKWVTAVEKTAQGDNPTFSVSVDIPPGVTKIRLRIWGPNYAEFGCLSEVVIITRGSEKVSLP